MTYEDDYKKWLEEMLIESNPDWVCDGMYDLEFTHEWCGKHCGEDSNYVTPKCLHLYYHHIARADRKNENSSEIPNKPTISKMEQVDKDINVRSKDEPQTMIYPQVDGITPSVIEPQTETEIAKAIVHKMIDDAVIAEDAYPDLRQKMHDAVDEYEPQTDCAWR